MNPGVEAKGGPPEPTTCAQCPFRRDSLAGYLGAYESPGEFLQEHYHREITNPCHMTIDYDRSRLA